MTIQQKEFIELLAVRLSLTYTDAEKYIREFKKLIYELLAEGKRVNLQGFGQFISAHRQARAGVNPRTQEKIQIPSLNTPKFVAGEAFKEALKLQKE